MDSTHGLVATSGVVVGWWLFSHKEEVKVDPPTCHCVCNIKPELPVKSESDNSHLWFGILILVILLGLNLVLVLKVTVKSGDSGERDYSFSLKGKQGKGVYGAPRGLQILDAQ